jgi:hypothetical protein
MSQLLFLGAINKNTNTYVYPKIANKSHEYICPDCGNDVIICQGKIIKPYFRHKVDREKLCQYYNSPTESQIHKDAKVLMKTLILNKVKISLIRDCCCCKKKEEIDIPEIDEYGKIQIEYRFEFNGTKIADVGYTYNDEILCIFEICNTHKTLDEDRPEPWFEIHAETLITIANDDSLTHVQIPCMRMTKCDDCLEHENKNLKKNDIEKYVRMKLGQTYPITEYIVIEKTKRIKHLRINFHAEYIEEIEQNKKLVELFKDDYIDKYIVIHTYKGSGHAFIIPKKNYERNKDKYWDRINYDPCDETIENLYFEKVINITCMGTIQIIIKLIQICEELQKFKLRKTLSKDKTVYVRQWIL